MFLLSRPSVFGSSVFDNSACKAILSNVGKEVGLLFLKLRARTKVFMDNAVIHKRTMKCRIKDDK